MVEAVVAIPFFIIIFVSMLYVGNLYAEKQRTLREAKQQSWAYALNNCEGNSGNATKQGEGDPMGELNSQGGGVSPQGQKYSSAAGGGELTQNWGTASVTVKADVTADKLLGGMTHRLSTTTRMQCNEKPQDGNVSGVLHMAWNLFKFW